MRSEYPEFRDWSIPAVRLLQGVVEQEDGRVWDVLLSNTVQLEQYFARLGMQLMIDESEGLAYLKQISEDTLPTGYEAIPKLFRSTRLSYGQTLLCVLLRDALRRFEEEDTHDDRCVVSEADLLDQWKGFFLAQGDEVRQLRDLQSTLKKLDELGFVRRFGDEPPAWEVRRILKARLTADELEHLHRQLQTVVEQRAQGDFASTNGAGPTHQEFPSLS